MRFTPLSHEGHIGNIWNVSIFPWTCTLEVPVHIQNGSLKREQVEKNPCVHRIDKWINKMWCIHTMEYYSTLKRKDILAHATMWMNLEDMTLSEISQSQKRQTVWFHLYKGAWIVKSIETESGMWWLPGAGGRGNGELLFNGDWVTDLQDAKCSEDGWWWWLHNNVNVLNTTAVYT